MQVRHHVHLLLITLPMIKAISLKIINNAFDTPFVLFNA